jgi:hypothetical protein
VITAVAVLGCVVLGGLAAFQAMLAAGQPWGRLAWGGQHPVLPTNLRVSSAMSIVAYASFATIILSAAGIVSVLSDEFVDLAIWVLTGYFTLGIVMNGVSRSRSERLVMTPVAVLLAVSCLVVALG